SGVDGHGRNLLGLLLLLAVGSIVVALRSAGRLFTRIPGLASVRAQFHPNCRAVDDRARGQHSEDAAAFFDHSLQTKPDPRRFAANLSQTVSPQVEQDEFDVSITDNQVSCL